VVAVAVRCRRVEIETVGLSSNDDEIVILNRYTTVG
jgi:hypothetical protein